MDGFIITTIFRACGAFVAGLEEIVMILELLDEEKACYEFRSQLVTENTFSTDRHFSGPYCEQMETDLKNPPHGFSPELAHLSLLRNILLESDDF